MEDNFPGPPPYLGHHIEQCKLFNSKYNIEAMNYDDMSWIFHDYIESFLNDSDAISRLNISPQIKEKIQFYVMKIEEYLRNKITDEELNSFCNENFKERDKKEKEIGRHWSDLILLEIVQYGLFNRNRSSLDSDGADYLIGFIFADIGKLGDEYCKKFRERIEKHPRMQKFKITTSS